MSNDQKSKQKPGCPICGGFRCHHATTRSVSDWIEVLGHGLTKELEQGTVKPLELQKFDLQSLLNTTWLDDSRFVRFEDYERLEKVLETAIESHERFERQALYLETKLKEARAENAALTKDCNDLSLSNAALKAENERLEKTLDALVPSWRGMDTDGRDYEQAAIHLLQREGDALKADAERLREVRDLLPKIIEDAYVAWDTDREARVGKILGALLGYISNYREDITKVRAALAAREET